MGIEDQRSECYFCVVLILIHPVSKTSYKMRMGYAFHSKYGKTISLLKKMSYLLIGRKCFPPRRIFVQHEQTLVSYEQSP